MSTHNICFLQEIRKKISIFGQVNLVGQMAFDHLLVRGRVMKFDISTALPSLQLCTQL